MPTLTSLSLGGFQVFDQLTRIPLGPFTLLFGPNSAGKSAVHDALNLLHAFWNEPGERHEWAFGLWGHEETLLLRHWRRTAETDYAPCPLQLHMTIAFGAAGRSHYRADALANWAGPGAHTLEAHVEFHAESRRGREEGGASVSVALHADGAPLLRYADYKNAELNLEHAWLQSERSALAVCIAHTQTPGSPFALVGGWLVANLCMDEGFSGRFRDYLQLELEREARSDFDRHPERTGLPRVAPAAVEFEAAFEGLLKAAGGALAVACDAHLVDASRAVPTDSDLTFAVYPMPTEEAPRGLPVVRTGAPRYAALGRIAATAAWQRDIVEALPGQREGNGSGAPWHTPLDAVNRMLSEHLFHERGYRLDADWHALVPRTRLARWASGAPLAELERDPPALLATLVLVDAEGRRFSFSDVGSGLGYVLPVLAAITQENRVFVQQPELHLHPALQASLADAFIDALTAETGPPIVRTVPRRQFIVETHSEHFLLRLLKRVRQSRRTDAPPAPTLRADQLVVLYFDPRPDGSTSVKHLRLSANGEFLDRWPRGFFTEREQDLFDE